MKMTASCVKTAAAATVGAVLAIVGASMSPAAAMPVGAGVAADGPPLLTQVQVGQHLKYPGSNSAAAKARRAQRNAPNYICDKQPSRCQ